MRIAIFILACCSVYGAEWTQYRGPQGTGIADTSALPTRFGPGDKVVWRAEIPEGHSSPVLADDCVYLTGFADERLYVFAVSREDGRELWRREVPRPRHEIFNATHGPASPTPVTDGRNVYAFFGDFGLIAFDRDGEELWRKPMGPFGNINGHGSSPIIADGMLILLVDQNSGSFLTALDPASGEQIWKADRSEVTRGYGTPGVFRPGDAPDQLVVPGAYRVISYDLKTGEKLWWVDGMAWQLKCVPLFDGDTIYINAWESGGDPGQRKQTPSFAATLADFDADGDGLLSQAEVPDKMLKSERGWIEHDLDADNFLNQRDWDFYAMRRSPINNLVAIQPKSRTGDITDSAVLWRYSRSLPNTPSPLLYDDALYLVKDGGIFQTVDTKTGEPLKLARLPAEAIDKYWASPVMGDGKIYLVNEACAVTVVKPGAEWEVLAVNRLEDRCIATPAIADGRIYIRTSRHLYAFGER